MLIERKEALEALLKQPKLTRSIIRRVLRQIPEADAVSREEYENLKADHDTWRDAHIGFSKIAVLCDPMFCEMLLFALRYSLGRMTYAVKDTTSYIRCNVRHIDDSTLAVMARDIREQEKYGYGMHFDEYEWKDLLRVIERELERRKEDGVERISV